MKRIVSGIVAAAMVLVMSGAAMAEEGTKVSAGLKLWMNTLKSEPGDNSGSSTSDSAILVGPAVEAEFSNNVFAEASYVTTATKYKIDQVELDRNDIDVAVGYKFVPNAGVYAGYRIENLKASGFKDTVSGLLIGVRGSYPVADALSVYGDLAYLMFTDKTEQGGVSVSESAPGLGFEIGVKYAFNKQVNGSLGYKYENTKGGDSQTKTTFSGFTLAGMYNF